MQTILNTDIFSWIKLEISRSIIASRKFLSACGSIMYLNVVLSVVTCSEIKLDISRLILLLSFSLILLYRFYKMQQFEVLQML